MSSGSPCWTDSLFLLNNLMQEMILSSGTGACQWFLVIGPDTVGTDRNTGGSLWTSGNTFSLWGWLSTGTGCPGKWWSRSIPKPFCQCPGQLALGGPAWAGWTWTRWEVLSNINPLWFRGLLGVGHRHNCCILLFGTLHRKMHIKWDIVNLLPVLCHAYQQHCSLTSNFISCD